MAEDGDTATAKERADEAARKVGVAHWVLLMAHLKVRPTKITRARRLPDLSSTARGGSLRRGSSEARRRRRHLPAIRVGREDRAARRAACGRDQEACAVRKSQKTSHPPETEGWGTRKFKGPSVRPGHLPNSFRLE